MNQPKSVTFSCFLYRVALSLGPSAFRMELQSLLLSDFRHLCLKAHEQAGAKGVFVLLPIHMLHTFCDIGGEHFDLIKSQTRKIVKALDGYRLRTRVKPHSWAVTYDRLNERLEWRHVPRIESFHDLDNNEISESKPFFDAYYAIKAKIDLMGKGEEEK